MAALTQVQLILPLLLMLFAACMGETCVTRKYLTWNNQYDYEKTYCLYGCCGTFPDQYCCHFGTVAWVVWAIVGGVVGGILLISFIIALLCFCLKQQKQHRGRVIHPATNTPAGNPAIYSQSSMTVSGTNGQFSMHASSTDPMATYSYPPPPPVYTPPRD